MLSSHDNMIIRGEHIALSNCICSSLLSGCRFLERRSNLRKWAMSREQTYKIPFWAVRLWVIWKKRVDQSNEWFWIANGQNSWKNIKIWKNTQRRGLMSPLLSNDMNLLLCSLAEFLFTQLFHYTCFTLGGGWDGGISLFLALLGAIACFSEF